VVEVTLLRLGDQPLRERTQPLGLRLGGADAAVLEELRGEVRQDQPLVGGAAAKTPTLGGLGHFLLSFSSPARPYQVPGSGRGPAPLRVAPVVLSDSRPRRAPRPEGPERPWVAVAQTRAVPPALPVSTAPSRRTGCRPPRGGCCCSTRRYGSHPRLPWPGRTRERSP